MTNPIFFAPLRVPVTDPNTGLMSRPWYLFLQAIYNRVGGSTGPGNDDLEQLVNEDIDIASVDQVSLAQGLADAQALGLDIPADPISTDVLDAVALLLETSQDPPGNPSAKVGLAAIPGTSILYMRADAAPALDLTIAPTWLGNHTFQRIGVNGNAPPAQPTGYGTPTGGAHQTSFAAGAITLPNLAAAVAQLIIELKALGFIGT